MCRRNLRISTSVTSSGMKIRAGCPQYMESSHAPQQFAHYMGALLVLLSPTSTPTPRPASYAGTIFNVFSRNLGTRTTRRSRTSTFGSCLFEWKGTLKIMVPAATRSGRLQLWIGGGLCRLILRTTNTVTGTLLIGSRRCSQILVISAPQPFCLCI